jgi:uncharacterized repeat protein (TIGR01451 family)
MEERVVSMKRIIMLVTLAGRRLAADGVPFIDSRHARRLLVLGAMLTAAMVVGLLGYATSARADADCLLDSYCLEKTVSADPAQVGEPLTFTIRGFCGPAAPDCVVINDEPVRDTLPAGLDFVSASATGNGNPTCTFSESDRTVSCSPFNFRRGQPFEATIEVIPRECGTFTNTATAPPGVGGPVSETFTVECPPPLPTTKEQCKKGGWEDFGYPDQGTCISDVNRRNRQ